MTKSILGYMVYNPMTKKWVSDLKRSKPACKSYISNNKIPVGMIVEIPMPPPPPDDHEVYLPYKGADEELNKKAAGYFMEQELFDDKDT